MMCVISLPSKREADYGGDMGLLEAIRFIRHPRARRMKLRVDLVSGEVKLTAPRYVSRAQMMAFLEANQNWVERQRARLTPPTQLRPGARLTVFGLPRVLEHQPGLRGARFESDLICVGGQSEFFVRRVLALVRREAHQLFQQWADEFAAQLGLPLRPVRVRDTRSRWGSCTVAGDINLSWRLAFAPPEVARYVVAHEVAHRLEMNHSPAFWAIVNQLVGEVSSHRLWLVQQGHQLLRLGVAAPPPGES
jgi:predicted metal-dependent hydrolase